MMGKPAKFAFVALSTILVAPGCGETQTDGDATETLRGELGAFGPWQSAGGVLVDGPALARAPGTTLTAFGLGVDDHEIWMTAQNASGQWTGAWMKVPGGPFTSRPAAVAITSGELVNHFAIMAKRSDDEYYLRIQDQTGSHVTKDWEVFRGPWVGAPALAFVPASPLTSRSNSLVMVGVVRNYPYYYAYFMPLDNDMFVGQWAFVGGRELCDTDPALTFVQPTASGQSFMMMAAGVGTSPQIVYKISRLKPTCGPRLNDCSQWQPWQPVLTGLFKSGPALGMGTLVPVAGTEVTLYGRGGDDRIWVTNQLPGGSFWSISNQTFGGNPSATGLGGRVYVGGLIDGTPNTSFAKSPFSPLSPF